nr:hypothetical protein Q903MT_gene3691 [Picea sitchensis]
MGVDSSFNHNIESIAKASCSEFVSAGIQGDLYMRISSFCTWGIVLYLLDLARL